MRHRRFLIIAAVLVTVLIASALLVHHEVRQGRRMHAALELALAQNRSGVPFRSDTIYLDATSFMSVSSHALVLRTKTSLHW